MKRWRLNPLVKGLALALALLGAPVGAGETPTGQAHRESLGIDGDAAISGNPAATHAKPPLFTTLTHQGGGSRGISGLSQRNRLRGGRDSSGYLFRKR